jgi:hypothetical protein
LALSSEAMLRLQIYWSLLGLHTVPYNAPCSPSLAGCLDSPELLSYPPRWQPYMSSFIPDWNDTGACRAITHIETHGQVNGRRGGIVSRRLVGYHTHMKGPSSRLQIQSYKTGVSMYPGAETERILTRHSLGWPTLYLVDPFRSSPNSP